MRTLGYCQTKQEATILRVVGLSSDSIYCQGVGAETLSAVIKSFRDQPGVLILPVSIITKKTIYGAIRLVGFSKEFLEEIAELIEVVSGAKTLRALFNSL